VLAVWLITVERLKEADCDMHDVKRLSMRHTAIAEYIVSNK